MSKTKKIAPSKPTIKPGDARARLQRWATRINAKRSACVAMPIETGRELIRAKSQLPHGEWLRLFKDELVEIHLREAQRLMRIAEHPVIANANNYSLLPASPQTLDALAKADPTALQKAIDANLVTCQTTLREAKRFQVENLHARKSKPSEPAEFDLNACTGRCSRLIWAEFNRCPDAFQDFLIDELRNTLDAMAELAQSARQQAQQIPAPTA